MISQEHVARIRHLFHAEHWKVGTICAQLGVHREAVEDCPWNPVPPIGPPRGVHCTELPEAKPGEPLAEEWNTYRRQVSGWLAEGRDGMLGSADCLFTVYPRTP